MTRGVRGTKREQAGVQKKLLRARTVGAQTMRALVALRERATSGIAPSLTEKLAAKLSELKTAREEFGDASHLSTDKKLQELGYQVGALDPSSLLDQLNEDIDDAFQRAVDELENLLDELNVVSE